MKSNVMTRGALVLAQIFVCFTIFKGVTNIFNALLVPLILSFGLFKLTRKEILTVQTASMLFCLIFFRIQTIFMFSYCIMSFILIWLNKKNGGWVFSIALLTAAISFSFWISLVMTDFIFQTRINYILINLLGGNLIAYSLLLVIEGFLLGLIQIFVLRKLGSRISEI